ncbi:MAG: hypothetical protein JKY56_14230 [Kofleriaceae bacterium]|nr:hypothetical protein [Kofleriaceae bacterium]
MNLKILSASLLLLLACTGDKESDKGAAGSSAEPTSAKPAEKSSKVPTDKERIVLNTDGHSIPASIEMPKGSSIFADEPTSLRVGYDGKDKHGRQESLFAVQIRKGNEFNLDLKEKAKDLAKNLYGSTHEMLEQTEALLFYKSTVTEGGFTSHSFSLIVELGGEKWICMQGNDGGWSEEQARAQIDACKTLKAI